MTPSTVSPFQVFGTGLDNSGHVLADGTPDSHYAILSGPSTAAPAVLPQGGFPFPYWLQDGVKSAWITPGDALAHAGNGYQEPEGDYVYETTFDLTGYDPTTAAITGQIGADNTVTQVLLNGQDVGYSPTNVGNNFGSLNSLTITSGFTPGVNTLDFVVHNDPGDSYNPTGFRAELSGTAQLVGTPFQVYGTGVDGAGNLLADGVPDPHYQLIAAPAPDATGAPFVTIQNGFPFPYWTGDGPNSKWISPEANENDMAGGATDPVGDYIFETTFDLTGYDATTARIAGLVSADNTLVEIDLNGHNIGYTPGGVTDYTDLHPLVIDSGFQAGVNTLDIVVYNAPQPDGSNAHNPSAFRAELSGTAQLAAWSGPIITAPSEALEGDSVQFSAAATESPAGGTPIYTWNFGDGVTASGVGLSTVNHAFAVPATLDTPYDVTVTVSDGPNSASASSPIVIDNVAPTVYAGTDQSATIGQTVGFDGTATDPGGSSDIVSLQWDFNYDCQSFQPDTSATGSLTPNHVFTTPGAYIVALQATDASGASSLSMLFVTVADVPPTASVANSGGKEGSPVTFTVSSQQDLNPADAITYYADWDGSGQFTMIAADELTTHTDGSVSFTHVYDEHGTYNAVIELADASGGATDYGTTVTVTDAPLTADFGAQGGGFNVSLSTPFVFTNVSDPSQADTAAGFTYHVSIDGGDFVSSSSPSFLLPPDLASGVHTVAGYVSDIDGEVSPTVTDQVTAFPAEVVVQNAGTGSVLLSWDGGPSGGVMVGPNQQLVIDGAADGFTATLQTAGATYALATNAGFAQVNAADGVTGVTLSVSTELSGQAAGGGTSSYVVTAIDGTSGGTVGSGDVGEIDLPTASTLTLQARGDLGSVVGADTTDALTGASAGSLAFTDLTGSITGLDSVASINATGWLGTNASEQVAVWQGIQNLTAYGVGATVQTDVLQGVADPALDGSIGAGGLTGTFTAGNVANLAVGGAVSSLTARDLSGELDLAGAVQDGLVFLQQLEVTSKIETDRFNIGVGRGYISQLVIGSGGENTTQTLKNVYVAYLLVLGSLTVNGDFTPILLNRLDVSGDLTVHGNVVARAAADSVAFDVGGDLQVDGSFTLALRSLDLTVLGTAEIDKGLLVTARGAIDQIRVDGNLLTDIQSPTSQIGSIQVGGNFEPSRAAPGGNLILADTIGDITALNIDEGRFTATNTIKSQKSIGNVLATGGDIAVNIICGAGLGHGGEIASVVADPVKDATGNVIAGGTIQGEVLAMQGDIDLVKAYRINGPIIALAQRDNGQKTNFQGDIGTVQADVGLPSIIRAENHLVTVILTGKKADPNSQTEIIASGSGLADAYGVAKPIVINFMQDAFLGKVVLTYTPGNPPSLKPTDVIDSERDHFKNGDQLFQIAQIIIVNNVKMAVTNTYTVDRTNAATVNQVSILNFQLTENEKYVMTSTTPQMTTGNDATPGWEVQKQ